MVEQLTLLVLVVAVAAGLVTVTFSALLVRARQTAFFRTFLANILLFNLLILAGLVFQHAQLQSRLADWPFQPILLLGLLAVLTVLKLGWLYVFASMMLVLPGQGLPERFGRNALTVSGAVLVGWAALLAVGLGARLPALVENAILAFEVAIIAGAGAACVHLLVRSRELPADTRRRAVRVFGAMHLGVFATMLVSLGLGRLQNVEGVPYTLFFNGLVMVAYNLLPLAWLLRFQPLGPVNDPGGLDRFGISAREREIIELICSGRTNQEIAERLFISPATVKDHNYNIFRKTGVRNRVELANLWRSRGAGPGESS